MLEILITYTSVRNYLSKYGEFIEKRKYGDAQAQCQIAFIELLNEYCKQYDRGLDLVHSPATNAYYLKRPNLEDKTDKCIENIKDDLIKINEAINIMNMGINYCKYSEFKAMGPSIIQWIGEERKYYDYYIMNIDFYDKIPRTLAIILWSIVLCNYKTRNCLFKSTSIAMLLLHN